MVKCVFCGKDEDYFRGMNYISNDGNTHFFCSSKCRKNALQLKRDKRKLKWTAAYQEERAKTIVKDKAKADKAAGIEVKVESKKK